MIAKPTRAPPLDRPVGVKFPDSLVSDRLDPVGSRTGERKTLASKVVALTVAAFAALSSPAPASDLTNTFNRADLLTQQADVEVPSP